MENSGYSKLGNYNNRSEKIITKVCQVTTKSIDLVSKDLKKSFEISLLRARIKGFGDTEKHSATVFRKMIRRLTREISH